MRAFVIRCFRAQAHAGKAVRAAIRHHWHVGHATAHVIYHGSLIVCVVVPITIAALNPPLSIPPSPTALVFTHPPIAIPEPTALPVFLLGIAILLRLRKRT